MKKVLLLMMVAALVTGANAASILLVTDGAYNSGDARYDGGVADSEADFTAWLNTLGHTVTTGDGWAAYRQASNGGTGAAGAQAYIDANPIDLVIISRNTNSGAYNEFAWNDIDVPMLNMSAYLARRSRWDWSGTNSLVQPTATEIDMGGSIVPFTTYTEAGKLTVLSACTPAEVDGGTVVATIAGAADQPAIVRWNAGVVMESGDTSEFVTPQTAAAKRTLMAGIPYHESVGYTDSLGNPATLEMTFDHFTPEAKALIAGEIDLLLVPEPTTMVLLGLGGLVLRKRR